VAVEDESTAAMLDATRALLAAYGVRRWTMDDVAERSGLGRATVYRRFESRDELVHAALAREAQRFFAEVAEAVSQVESLVEKVVEGLLVGLRLARESLLPGLYRGDPATLVSLLTSTSFPPLARLALVERYQAIAGGPLSPAELAEAELIAEVLVRLGMSFFLMPGSVIDFDDPEDARRALRRVVAPLLSSQGKGGWPHLGTGG
jgi:AcrR family transcriptional regulator